LFRDNVSDVLQVEQKIDQGGMDRKSRLFRFKEYALSRGSQLFTQSIIEDRRDIEVARLNRKAI